jgi:hypothetical protein
MKFFSENVLHVGPSQFEVNGKLPEFIRLTSLNMRGSKRPIPLCLSAGICGQRRYSLVMTQYGEENATFTSPLEAEAFYDFIEWAGTQS